MIHEKVFCNMSPIVIYGKFLGGSAGKDSVCNAGDLGFDPWVGKIPWRRERLPTPVFWLENPMDYTVHGVAKSWT